MLSLGMALLCLSTQRAPCSSSSRRAFHQQRAIIFTGTRCVCVSEAGFTLRALLDEAVLIPFVRVRAEELIPTCVLSHGITLCGQKEPVDSAAVDSVGFLSAASSLELAAARKSTGVFIPGLLSRGARLT